MNHLYPRRVVVMIGFGLLTVSGCGGGSPSGPQSATAAPAKVENPVPESELASITLSADAEKHLAIQTMKVAMGPVALTRTVGGEAVVPPGKTVTVTAPIAGTLSAGPAAMLGAARRGSVIFELVPLQQPDRDVRAEAERVLAEAEARLTLASQKSQRLEQLLKEGSASVRATEEARAERTTAAAAVDAARKRVESVGSLAVGPHGEVALKAPFDGTVIALRAAAGQTVAAGAPVAELAQTDALWIRAPLYAGDLAGIDPSARVLVARLGQETSGPWREIRRVTGPPAADSAAASVDLFFALTGPGSPAIRPGERVAVRLPLKSASRALVIPQSAVVYDISGGTWVYEARGQHRFARRRVELAGPAGTNVIVARGLAEGLTIVTVGAAELYGTEFYVNK